MVLCPENQMTLRKLLASIVAVTLLAGLSALAPVQAAEGDCATVSGPADGCCGGADMAGCPMACSMVHAAIGSTVAQDVPVSAGSPLERDAAFTRSVSRPPDTTPPKFFSA